MTTKTDDMAWIKGVIGIDPKTTTPSEAAKILRTHEINTTSWVLTTLEQVYGPEWADSYRASIAGITCSHGFIGDCPYCKWGTD